MQDNVDELLSGDEAGMLDDDDDDIAEKFDCLVNKSEKACAEASKGMTLAQILQEAAKQQEAEASAKHSSAVPAAGETVLSTKKAPLKKRTWDDIESDEDPERLPRIAPKSKAKASAGSSSQGSRRFAGPSSRGAGAGAKKIAEPGVGGEAGAAGNRGRPKMTVEQNALRELASFDQVTTCNSNYFNDHSLVTQKCLKRYIFQAETSESKVRDTEENNAVVMQLRLDKRRLQYIESGLRIGQKWHGSGGLEERVAATLRLWEALVSFCACEPKVTIKCEYVVDAFGGASLET